MKLYSKFFVALFSTCALLMTACGEDSSSAKENATLTVVSSKSDLKKCDKSKEGAIAYITGTGELMFCLDKEWQAYGVGDIPVYEGSDGADGIDGSNGSDGKDGVDGKDGTSCTGEYLPDSSGINLYCGGKLVGTIMNGSNGLSGGNGGTTADIEFNTADYVEIGDTVWSYSDSLLIRVSDNDILAKKDTVEVSVTSTSDSKGIVFVGIFHCTTPVYDIFVLQTHSHPNCIGV